MRVCRLVQTWRTEEVMAKCGVKGRMELVELHREELIWLWHGERSGGTEAGKPAHALIQMGQTRILNSDSFSSCLIYVSTCWRLFTLFN